MITLLFNLLICLIVLYVAKLVIAEMGLPAPIARIALLIVGLIALFYVIGLFGVFPAGNRLYYWR